MSTKTFTVNFTNVCVDPARDGLFGIFSSNSNVDLEIKKVDARVTGPFGPTQLSRLALSRISAVTLNGAGETVIASKFNTASADLPAQVKFYRPTDLLATASDVFRRYVEQPGNYGNLLNGTRIPIAVRRNGSKAMGCDILMNIGDRASVVQPIVLREGEGIALFPLEPGCPHAGLISLVMRVVATGACYVYSEVAVPMATETLDAPIFALFNGTGSGVVLEVTAVRASVQNEGDATGSSGTAFPAFRLANVDGYFDGPDTTRTFTPVAHDTRNALPTGISCVSGFQGLGAGSTRGVPYDFFRWNTSAQSFWGNSTAAQMSASRIRQKSVGFNIPNSSGTGPAGMVPWWETVYDAKKSDGIIIRAGLGFAALAGGYNNGDIGGRTSFLFHFRVTFIVRNQNAALASGGSYVG